MTDVFLDFSAQTEVAATNFRDASGVTLGGTAALSGNSIVYGSLGSAYFGDIPAGTKFIEAWFSLAYGSTGDGWAISIGDRTLLLAAQTPSQFRAGGASAIQMGVLMWNGSTSELMSVWSGVTTYLSSTDSAANDVQHIYHMTVSLTGGNAVVKIRNTTLGTSYTATITGYGTDFPTDSGICFQVSRGGGAAVFTMTFMAVACSATVPDGSAAAPWGRLHQLAGLSASDVVWMRRSSYTEYGYAPGFHLLPSGITLVGWPKVGDSRYASRPVAAQAAWDGDAADYAELRHRPAPLTTTSLNIYHSTLGYASNTTHLRNLARLKIVREAPTGDTVDTGVFTTNSTQGWAATATYNTEKCWFEMDSRVSAFWTYVIMGWHNQGGSGGTGSIVWTDVGSVMLQRHAAGLLPSPLFYTKSANSPVYLKFYFKETLMRHLFESTFDHGNNQLFYNDTATNATLEGWFDRCSIEWVGGDLLNTVDAMTKNALQAHANGFSFIRCSFKCPGGARSGSGRLGVQNMRVVECTFDGFNSVLLGPYSYFGAAAFNPGGVDTVYGALDVTAGVGGIARIAGMRGIPGAYDINIAGAPGHATVLARGIYRVAGVNIGMYGSVYQSDVDGTPGYSLNAKPAGTMAHTNARRQSGGRFSYRLYAASISPVAEACGVAQADPGFDTIFASVPAGTSTITVYIALLPPFNGGASATKATAWMDAEISDSGLRDVVTTREDEDAPSALISDSSTWDNINGSYTALKLQKTVTVAAAQVVPLRIYISRPQQIMFVDPLPEVA